VVHADAGIIRIELYQIEIKQRVDVTPEQQTVANRIVFEIRIGLYVTRLQNRLHLTSRNRTCVTEAMRADISRIGQRKVARQAGIARRTIERFMRGENVRNETFDKLWRFLFAS
jgi:hypothetical protein